VGLRLDAFACVGWQVIVTLCDFICTIFYLFLKLVVVVVVIVMA